MNENAIYKALSHPVRRQILEWLKTPELYFPNRFHNLDTGVCASEIDSRCELSQSTISAHLATLQQAKLVSTVKIGQWIFYSRNEATINEFKKLVKEGL